MGEISLTQLVHYCDATLRTAEIKDYDRAVNGLQVENAGQVTRIAAAVDASRSTVKLAIATGADLLIVHHGLFWGASHPWTGPRYDLIRTLVKHNLAVYSSHLPLDVHPDLGNNARFCAAMGLRRLTPFFQSKGQPIGFLATAKIARSQLVKRVQAAVNGPVKLIATGPSRCAKIGVVTGGAGAELAQAAAEGVDTFITGEGPHWTFALAEDLRINVIYAGHYATETFGVKALAEHLSRKYRVPWEFIDHPTGL
jgi:dinuclear metal center YbgI/SA1388 family protein